MKRVSKIIVFVAAMPLAGWCQPRAPFNRADLDMPTPGLLSYDVQKLLGRLGDRVEKPGKERVLLTGDLNLPGGRSANVQMVYELAGGFRLQEQGGDRRDIGFDGARHWSAKGQPDELEEGLGETLLNDSAEQFFLGLTRGMPMRLLGERFRSDDGSSRVYSGPWHDIYETYDPIKVRGRAFQFKHYSFRSETGFLERVRYEQSAASGTGKAIVETRISGWTVRDGQALPGRIERWRDGVLQFGLTVRTSVFQPKRADGVFARP